MISHFVQNYDPTCKRCEHAGLRPAPKETVLHIFWDCPCILVILNDVKKLISNDPIADSKLREILFLGSDAHLQFSIKTTNKICLASLFFIFYSRNNKAVYSMEKLIKFINVNTNGILSFVPL